MLEVTALTANIAACILLAAHATPVSALQPAGVLAVEDRDAIKRLGGRKRRTPSDFVTRFNLRSGEQPEQWVAQPV